MARALRQWRSKRETRAEVTLPQGPRRHSVPAPASSPALATKCHRKGCDTVVPLEGALFRPGPGGGRYASFLTQYLVPYPRLLGHHTLTAPASGAGCRARPGWPAWRRPSRSFGDELGTRPTPVIVCRDRCAAGDAGSGTERGAETPGTPRVAERGAPSRAVAPKTVGLPRERTLPTEMGAAMWAVKPFTRDRPSCSTSSTASSGRGREPPYSAEGTACEANATATATSDVNTAVGYASTSHRERGQEPTRSKAPAPKQSPRSARHGWYPMDGSAAQTRRRRRLVINGVLPPASHAARLGERRRRA